SLAARFEPAHGTADDLARLDAVEPVVGYRVGAEDDERPRGKLLLDRFRLRQAGDAKEWRHFLGVAKRGAYGGNAVVDLVLQLLDREALEAGRMILAVRADRVPGGVHPAHRRGICVGHGADEEIRRLDALCGENIEDLLARSEERR